MHFNLILKLLLILLAVASIVFIANLFDENVEVLIGDLLYIPIAGSFVVIVVLVFLRFGLEGTYGKAWLFFTFFGILWFIAEMIWAYNELILGIDPYPSIADFFWLAGYPFLFSFMVLYIRPFRKAITKRNLATTIGISLMLLVLVIAITMNTENSESFEIYLLTISYPILDSLILAPAIIGLILFFKGQVNFLWSMICLGILLDVFADIGFFITQSDASFQSGSALEILFLWAYVFYGFGAYSHLKIFRTSKK